MLCHVFLFACTLSRAVFVAIVCESCLECAFCATKVNEIQHARVDRGVAYENEENAYLCRYDGEMACRTQRRWLAPAQKIYHDQDPPDDRMNTFYSKKSPVVISANMAP